MNFADLLVQILFDFRARWSKAPEKLRLLYLANIVDIFFVKEQGRSFLEGSWEETPTGLHRPDFDAVLSKRPFVVEGGRENMVMVTLRPSAKAPPMEDTVRRLIVAVVHNFGELPLRELVDYTLYEAKPVVGRQTP